MTALNQNRYDQLLRRVGDLKGPGSKVADALTELFPMIDVENIPAELLLLSGSRLCMARVVVNAGGATFFGHILLRNPGNSSVVARLIQVVIWSDTAQRMVIGPTVNSGTASGNRAFADGRVFGEGTVLTTHGDNNSLVVGSDFYRIAVNGVDSVIWEPPVAAMVITPATALSVSNGTDNTNLHVSFLWVERVAQPSELKL